MLGAIKKDALYGRHCTSRISWLGGLAQPLEGGLRPLDGSA